MKRKELLPVILGGDAGAYALALEFYEAFNVKSIFVSNAPAEIITRSSLASVEHIPAGINDEELLAVLQGIAALHTDSQLVLLANTDARASFAAAFREQLEPDYVVPFPSQDAMNKLCRKDSFAQVCSEHGALTPPTVVVDLSGSDVPEIPFGFPVVAKAASGDEYDRLTLEGKKKIWFIDTPEELSSLWQRLRTAGFQGKFLVQETIPGPDSQMVSLTLYVDSHGTATMLAGARVLLEDHSPTMVGNPVAMITRKFPDLWEQAQAILAAANYRGFANFDLKIDPRDGKVYFFEVNPRIGRNSYYVAAAGVNPMQVMVEDLVDGEQLNVQIASHEVLYSLVPMSLIRRYVDDAELVAVAKRLADDGKMVSPLEAPHEKNMRRKIVVALQKMNYHRKFAAYFPRSSDA
ncbi:carboxylate--amine ligase [Scrofimicrobium canadense]|uniref:carboxylate--amine ligase n=1 Tax=Scrofimicrobium canadense TaxID=2652290 RepID=UPI00298D8A6C|nr:carboxylate--amine ligase [Scrofimicrobium canadense]